VTTITWAVVVAGEITQNNGHYAVARSPVLVPVESPYATSYT